MIRPPRLVAAIVIGMWLVAAGCSLRGPHSPTSPLPFDTSYSAPKDWQLLDEPLWGIRLNVPPTLRENERGHKSLWINEGANLRVTVDFGNTSPELLKQQPHYAEARLVINGLPALVCSYDHTANMATGSLNKVVALFFLEKRKELGAPREPSYRVEYTSDDDRTIALQILQTVRFYDS
jgi:hypothetical protein